MTTRCRCLYLAWKPVAKSSLKKEIGAGSEEKWYMDAGIPSTERIRVNQSKRALLKSGFIELQQYCALQIFVSICLPIDTREIAVVAESSKGLEAA